MAKRGSIRIIGGRWRRRRLPVPDDDRVRPTPDRVRETLFNWLSDRIEGARCLDLFAGTGALGLEAASRGAADVVMIEQDRRLVENIEEAVATLGASNITVRGIDAFAYLAGSSRYGDPFDIVFLDPPFRRGLEQRACDMLAAHEGGRAWIAPGGRVYVESSRGRRLEWPDGWDVVREKDAGQVRYYLAEISGDEPQERPSS